MARSSNRRQVYHTGKNINKIKRFGRHTPAASTGIGTVEAQWTSLVQAEARGELPGRLVYFLREPNNLVRAVVREEPDGFLAGYEVDPTTGKVKRLKRRR